MAKKKPAPPNLRDAQCCGMCQHWQWGYEGEGDCGKYPDGGTAKHYNDATNICDEFEKRK